MSIKINKIVGVYNGKLIVLNSLCAPNHDDIYSMILSEYETLTRKLRVQMTIKALLTYQMATNSQQRD